MIMTGKILTDAGWAVPDSLREAMAEELQAAPPNTQGVAGNDIVSSLLEVADQVGQNPFDVYEYVNSLLAGFPPEASVTLLFELVAGKKPVIVRLSLDFCCIQMLFSHSQRLTLWPHLLSKLQLKVR